MTTDLTTSTWAIIGEHCPINCRLDGELVTMLIGRHRDAVQLDLTPAALRRIATVTAEVAAQLDAATQQEGTERRVVES